MINPNNGDNSYPLAPSCSNCYVLLITLLAVQTIQQQTEFDYWIMNWKIHGKKKSWPNLTHYARIYLERQRKNQTRRFRNYKLDALLLELIHSMLHDTNAKTCLWLFTKYRISRPIRRTFFPEKWDLNSTCALCAEGKYYFQTYKYLYIFYMKKVTHQVKTTMKMILVAVTMIFWVSMINKLYYGC